MKQKKSSPPTEEPLSRTEMKRQAKQSEAVARELTLLSLSEIKNLPCDDDLRAEIVLCRNLKGSACKRQTKFISKELRRASLAPFLAFLEQKKGSKLKKDIAFHNLERIRDAIIGEAIEQKKKEEFTPDHLFSSIQQAVDKFPNADLNPHGLQQSALRFAKTRKPVHKREIFRALQAAQEKEQYLVSRQG